MNESYKTQTTQEMASKPQDKAFDLKKFGMICGKIVLTVPVIAFIFLFAIGCFLETYASDLCSFAYAAAIVFMLEFKPLRNWVLDKQEDGVENMSLLSILFIVAKFFVAFLLIMLVESMTIGQIGFFGSDFFFNFFKIVAVVFIFWFAPLRVFILCPLQKKQKKEKKPEEGSINEKLEPISLPKID